MIMKPEMRAVKMTQMNLVLKVNLMNLKNSDTGMDVHDNSEDEVYQENILPVSQDMNDDENEETFLADFDLSLRDVVHISGRNVDISR